MPTYRYSGPTVTYGFLPVGKDQVAPVTVNDGDVVYLTEAPDDGHWEQVKGGKADRLPDNDPSVIAAADEAAANADPAAQPAELSPPTAGDSTHNASTTEQPPAQPAGTSGE